MNFEGKGLPTAATPDGYHWALSPLQAQVARLTSELAASRQEREFEVGSLQQKLRDRERKAAAQQQEADTATERCVSLERSLREKREQVGSGGKVRDACQGPGPRG